MPGQIGNRGGQKGRSGRRAQYYEIRIQQLANISVNWAIDNFDKLDKSDKMKIVTAIAPKYVPQNHNVQGDLNVNILVEEIQKARQRVISNNPHSRILQN